MKESSNSGTPFLTAKMSSKNQIVIPTVARSFLGLASGDEVALVPRGNVLIMIKKPKSYSDALAGILSKSIGERLRASIESGKESW